MIDIKSFKEIHIPDLKQYNNINIISFNIKKFSDILKYEGEK